MVLIGYDCLLIDSLPDRLHYEKGQKQSQSGDDLVRRGSLGSQCLLNEGKDNGQTSEGCHHDQQGRGQGNDSQQEDNRQNVRNLLGAAAVVQAEANAGDVDVGGKS